jgi:hypothetical protein
MPTNKSVRIDNLGLFSRTSIFQLRLALMSLLVYSYWNTLSIGI